MRAQLPAPHRKLVGAVIFLILNKKNSRMVVLERRATEGMPLCEVRTKSGTIRVTLEDTPSAASISPLQLSTLRAALEGSAC